MKTPRPDVQRIRTLNTHTEATAGQLWYETGTAWELWQIEPAERLKRVPKSKVYAVEMKP